MDKVVYGYRVKALGRTATPAMAVPGNEAVIHQLRLRAVEGLLMRLDEYPLPTFQSITETDQVRWWLFVDTTGFSYDLRIMHTQLDANTEPKVKITTTVFIGEELESGFLPERIFNDAYFSSLRRYTDRIKAWIA